MVFAWFTICFPHVPQQTCPQSWVNPVNPTCRVTMAVRPGLGQRDLRSWSDEIRLMYTSVNKCQSHMKHCDNTLIYYNYLYIHRIFDDIPFYTTRML